MVGKRLAISILAAAAALIATAAQAADYPQPPPPPIIIQQPIQEFDSWYLRGDIGITNQQVDRLSNVLDATIQSRTSASASTLHRCLASALDITSTNGFAWI